MSQKVQVVKVNADGIRAKIYGKDYAWNQAKNQFFIVSNGKWVAAEIPKFHQTVLKDRYGVALMTQRTAMGHRESLVTAEHRAYRDAQPWVNDDNDLYNSSHFSGKRCQSHIDDKCDDSEFESCNRKKGGR